MTSHNSRHDLAEFLARYDPDNTRVKTVIDAREDKDADGNSPLIMVRCGNRTAVIAAMEVGGTLDLDVHSFIDGKDAAAGVFGMTDGRRFKGFDNPDVRETSHGWPATRLVAVLIGEQGTKEEG